MRLLISMAWRNLWRNRRRTWITVFSVVFAVMLAMVLESMDRGSQEAMVRNVVQYSTGYVQVQDTLYFDEPNLDNSLPVDEGLLAHIASLDGVAYTAPRLESHALAAGAERTRVAFTLGIDPEAEDRFNGIAGRMADGAFFTGASQEVVIGTGLARSLSLGVNDTLVLLGQGYQGMTAAGKFVVAGLLKHPVPELDERIVLMPLEDAQWLYSAYDLLSYVMVVPQRLERHRQVAATLASSHELDGFSVYTWEELQPELVRTVEFDQAATLIFLLILYVVIAFGIFGTVLTMTLEREKEFGVLISIGLHRWKLVSILLLETLAINLLGVAIGLLIALPIMLWFFYNPIPLGEDMGNLMADYGMDAELKFSLDPQIFSQQGIIIFCIAMLVVLYPMLRVMGINVLDAARK